MRKTRLEQEAEELFGPMREATEEERMSVNLYIKKISHHISKSLFEEWENDNEDSDPQTLLRNQ